MTKKPENKQAGGKSSFEGYTETLAANVLEAMKKNEAPWQKPWDENSSNGMPRNGTTGLPYRGSNLVNLMILKEMAGFQSSEWFTFKQAQDMGGNVRKGEKSPASIVFWSEVKGVAKPGEKPADKDEEKIGTSRMVPRFYHVFNRDQIEGLPPARVVERPTEEWRHEKAEELIAKAGVKISHDGMGRAYYRPATDSIHLPEKSDFKSMDAYLATTLHELGHASGHESRLNRDLSGPFGSESYAREELRAEIASWLIGDRLAIGHDPAQHAAYTKHWVKILEDEPKEILRACADAEKICKFLGVEPYEQVLAQKSEQTQVAELPAPAMPPQEAQEGQQPPQPRRVQGRGR